MLEIFRKWYKRYLSEEESVLLLVLLTLSVILLVTIGDILAPMVAAIVLAYLHAKLLQGSVLISVVVLFVVCQLALYYPFTHSVVWINFLVILTSRYLKIILNL